MSKTALAASVRKATSGQPALVFSSLNASKLGSSSKILSSIGEQVFAKFRCTSCNTNVAAIASSSPFCITCGGETVKASGPEVKANVSKDEALTALKCSNCDTFTTVQTSVYKSITASSGDPTPIHCSCCGTKMFATGAIKAEAADEMVEDEDDIQLAELDNVQADADEEGDLEFTDADLEATSDSDMDDMEAGSEGDWPFEATSDDDQDEAIDEVVEEPVEGETITEVEDMKSEAAEDTPTEKEMLGKDVVAADDEVEVTVDDGSDVMDDDIQLEQFTVEEDPSAPEDNEDLAAMDEDEPLADDLPQESSVTDYDDGDTLADALDVDDTEESLAFVQASGRLVAMKGHYTVASLTRKDAGDNADLLFSPALTAATMSAVKAHGMRKGLESIGFKLAKVPVTTKAAVSREVQKIQASAAQAEQQKEKDFAATFALASAGLNRGNWRGYENPLRAAMETELARLGVTSPKRVVAGIFETAGLDYAKTLLSVTSKLSKLSASARQEMASMLDLTSVTASMDSSQDEDSEENDVQSIPIEARFSRPALLRPSPVSPAKSVTAAADILAGKAELTFSSF